MARSFLPTDRDSQERVWVLSKDEAAAISGLLIAVSLDDLDVSETLTPEGIAIVRIMSKQL